MTADGSRVIRLADALTGLPGPAGEHAIGVLRRGTLDIKLALTPARPGPSTAHAQDEVYVVIRGRGILVRDLVREPFESGSVLFVAAGAEHRFEGVSEDLVVWVVFHGPPGGEVPA